MDVKLSLYDGVFTGTKRLDWNNLATLTECSSGLGQQVTWKVLSQRISPPIDVCATITLDFDIKQLLGKGEASVNFPNWSGYHDISESVQHTWINW